MRISTSYISDLFLANLNQQQANIAQTQATISTGYKYTSPAGDPVAASQAITLQASAEQSTQFTANANLVQSRLSIEDTTLATVQNTLQSIRDLALQAGDPTQTGVDRAAIATQIKQQMDNLAQLANSQDGTGQFLFSGTASNTQPFSQTASGYQYNGNQTQRLVQIGTDRTVADGDTGARVFQLVRTGNGTFTVSASSANAGTAVVGPTSVVNPTAYTGASYTLTFTAPGTYQITDATNAVVATGTYTDGQSIVFNGMQMQLTGTPATNDSFAIAPSANQDLFTTISQLVSTLGGNVTPGAGQAAFQNKLNAFLTNVDQGLSNVANVRADVGARLNAISSQTSINAGVSLQLQTSLSNLRDTDFAAAITQLNQQMLSLQASQQSFVKLRGLSLFNYL